MGNLNPNDEHGGGGDPSGLLAGRSGERVIPFGKYLLLDRIAVGGMAEVFTAKSFGVEGFEKIIAIKRILPTMAEEEEFIAMFIDEAKIAGQLTHANIAPIYELGKIGQSHYIAMEYVWGKDLLQIMNRFRRMRRHMPPSMAAWIASKMCEALDFAHRKRDRHGRSLDIVHRDVSPQNCLVSYEGQVKMIDFGIAKAAMRTTKTQAGVLKGKFGYMSPEQVGGQKIDHRSDVFAVGTCMHEMLTSERLFVGESDFSTLEKVRNAEVVPPSMIAPGIPRELELIVLRALARESADRFQNAGEMHEALQMFIAKEKPPFGTSKLASWMRTAFSAEMTKEKARLDGLAKLDRPAQMPLPLGSREVEDLVEESTTISAAPFDSTNNGLSPFETIDSKTTDEEMRGDATQIFFSAGDHVDEEEPTTTMIGSVRAGLDPAKGIALGMPTPTDAPSTPTNSRDATGPEEPSPAPGFAPPPDGDEAGPKTVVNVPDAAQRSRAAAQDTIEILPSSRKPRKRRLLGVGLAIIGLVAMAAVVGLVLVFGRNTGGTIEIRITPAEANTTVLIDGTPRGRAPLRVEHVSAGAHLVEIQASGYQSVTQTVPVTDGAMAMLLIPLIPAVGGVPVVSPPVPAPVPAVANPVGSAVSAAPGAPAIANPGLPAVTVAPAVAAAVPAPGAAAPAPGAAAPAPGAAAPGAAVPAPGAAVPAPGAAVPLAAAAGAAVPAAGAATPGATAAGAARSPGAATAAPTPDASDEPAEEEPARRRRVARRRAPSTRPTSQASASAESSPTTAPQRGRGFLMIQTLPWARVFIDGRDTGQNTPVRQMAVPAGSHRIGLRTSDGQMHVITVEVPPGETVRVVRQL